MFKGQLFNRVQPFNMVQPGLSVEPRQRCDTLDCEGYSPLLVAVREVRLGCKCIDEIRATRHSPATAQEHPDIASALVRVGYSANLHQHQQIRVASCGGQIFLPDSSEAASAPLYRYTFPELRVLSSTACFFLIASPDLCALAVWS